MVTIATGSPATATQAEVLGTYDIYTNLACVQKMQAHPRDFEIIAIVTADPDDERGTAADTPTPAMYPLPEIYNPATGYSN